MARVVVGMGYYPTHETLMEDKPTCPNCGSVYEIDGERGFYDDGNTITIECGDCEMELVVEVNVSYSYTIQHPQHCSVRGYHTRNSHRNNCLFCQQPLSCSCDLYDKCTHDLPLFDTDTVSLCGGCGCMTHTINGHCGKCSSVKTA
jgi:hypothetical protein